MTKVKEFIVAVVYTLCIVFLAGLVGWRICYQTSFTNPNLMLVGENVDVEVAPLRYTMLPSQVSVYIQELSNSLDVDPDLVVAILLVENPEFNSDAIHRNNNGTLDLGLFQLNDAYIYTSFVPQYFPTSVQFQPFNWKHSTYIAIKHICHLTHRLHTVRDVVMAYNCGMGCVLEGAIPESTHQYYAKVQNYLTLLKATGGVNE